jgi:hypothetical protein
MRIGGGDGARLFHRERDTLGDQVARLLRHVAMAPEGEGEVRLQTRAHVAIVGEGRAAWLRRNFLGARDVGIADADHGHVRHCQQGIEIEGRVPVRHADQHDAHTCSMVDLTMLDSRGRGNDEGGRSDAVFHCYHARH